MAKKTLWSVYFPDSPLGQTIEAKTAQEVANILIRQGYTPAGIKVKRSS